MLSLLDLDINSENGTDCAKDKLIITEEGVEGN